jgi:hypothetical protein
MLNSSHIRKVFVTIFMFTTIIGTSNDVTYINVNIGALRTNLGWRNPSNFYYRYNNYYYYNATNITKENAFNFQLSTERKFDTKLSLGYNFIFDRINYSYNTYRLDYDYLTGTYTENFSRRNATHASYVFMAMINYEILNKSKASIYLHSSLGLGLIYIINKQQQAAYEKYYERYMLLTGRLAVGINYQFSQRIGSRLELGVGGITALKLGIFYKI